MASIVPAPISWTPSLYWDGNDGLWNSFIIQAGTPPQEFRVFPSTAGQETWLPVPDGCTAASPSDPGRCGYLRGALPVDGGNSSGYATNKSSTWDAVGVYTLDDQKADLGYESNGYFGLDTVVWGNTTGSPNLTEQVVAGIADPAWWLGLAGLGPKPSNFSVFNDPVPSYLSTLFSNDLIPSLSWGYTAGAAYRSRAPASLTLGSFDKNRFEEPGLSIQMHADNSLPLQVAVTQVSAENTLNTAVNLWTTPTYHFVDSSVPFIWVPEADIDRWIDSFGLTYDNNTDLYLLNDTVHNQLLELSPSITFTLAASTTDARSESENIRLPYAAFDLQASYPYYQNATNYFPIKKAANSTQYTLGRTFFQEAYVIADYGRSNFTIAQAAFDNLDSPHLIAIDTPASHNETSPSQPKTSSISAGAIAGIVVGAAAGLAVIGFLLWFFLTSKKQRSQKLPASDPNELSDFPNDKEPQLFPHKSELSSDSSTALHEADGVKPLSELSTPDVRNELDGNTARWGSLGVQELYASPANGLSLNRQELGATPIGHESGYLAEAPGSEGRWAEVRGGRRNPAELDGEGVNK